jgi:RIO kinase 1
VRDFEPARRRGRRNRRFDDDDALDTSRRRRGLTAPAADTAANPDAPETGDRWSTWDQSAAGERGPRPYPDWLITDLAAVDTELGVLKTGKEADVHLISRAVPDRDRSCLLAAKRYRDPEHRLFHRDAGYLEGRRVRRSRETRAMAKRTEFGRQMIAGQWAAAEFEVLCRLWQAGSGAGAAVVPYPVQLLGTEVLMEFVGDPDTGHAAPRLAQLRPDPDQLDDLWRQLVSAMSMLARLGLAHGDLSPYNILVHRDRLVLIDLPQVVDVVANPRGTDLLARDVRTVYDWFTARGLPDPDEGRLLTDLLSDAGVR